MSDATLSAWWWLQPWKQELAARMAQEALLVVYSGHSEGPAAPHAVAAAPESLRRPSLTATTVDIWNPRCQQAHSRPHMKTPLMKTLPPPPAQNRSRSLNFLRVDGLRAVMNSPVCCRVGGGGGGGGGGLLAQPRPAAARSWRDFHYGMGSVGGICRQQPWLGGGWASPCFGVRLHFDAPLLVEGSLDRFHRGLPSGFELGLAAPGLAPEWQPLTLFGLRDGNQTVQLNGTAAPFGSFAKGSLAVFEVVGIRYAWHDYPSMCLFAAGSGRPVWPFRAPLKLRADQGGDSMPTVS